MTDDPSAPVSPPAGVFCQICCQQGAETALKNELAPHGWRLAFSRPGFVTFKNSDRTPSNRGSLPGGVFNRTACWSIGKIRGAESAELLEQLRKLLASASDVPDSFDDLHVWTRDRLPVGERGFQPGTEPLTEVVADYLHEHLSSDGKITGAYSNQVAAVGSVVLNAVLVEPNECWVGWHTASNGPSRWPGGAFPNNRDRDVVSRAYFKTTEALVWSEFPLCDGDHVVEIGSSPGGSVQRLLELGLQVTGVDPADMDEEILEHENFRHVRARGGDIKRRDYASARWMLVDSNVKPEQTLLTVENIVTNDRTNIEGMLLTLKLSSYDRASEIQGWIDRIRAWGYKKVKARQLATGKKEICVAASD